MKLEDFPELLNVFVEKNKNEIGIIKLETSKPIDISIFPDEITKLPESNNGMYMFFSKSNVPIQGIQQQS